MAGLGWQSATDLAWTPPPWAIEFTSTAATVPPSSPAAAFRVPTRSTTTGTDAFLRDPAVPEPGALFVYIVTAEDANGAEAARDGALCAERAVANRARDPVGSFPPAAR